SEALLVGLGGDAQDGVADAELGVAEEGGVVGRDEVAGDGEQVVPGGGGDGGGQLLGLGLLRGGEGLLHAGLTDRGGGFLGRWPFSSLVYKDSTNCRDAQTPRGRTRQNGCGPVGRKLQYRREPTRPD